MGIVRDENVQIAIGLREHALKGEAEVVRALERRNDDRHERIDLR